MSELDEAETTLLDLDSLDTTSLVEHIIEIALTGPTMRVNIADRRIMVRGQLVRLRLRYSVQESTC
jgi:hypothetical protein